MRRIRDFYLYQVPFSIIICACYLLGAYQKQNEFILQEIEALQSVLKHNEKIWMYVQEKCKKKENPIAILTEVKNKMFWGSGAVYSGIRQTGIFLFDRERKDIERKINDLEPSKLEEDVNIKIDDRSIKVIFPLMINGQKYFLAFTHTAMNSYQITKKKEGYAYCYEIVLKRHLWPFSYSIYRSLLVLSLFAFLTTFFVLNANRNKIFSRIYTLYKKRAINKQLQEKELHKTKLNNYDLREGNICKLKALILYSTNYLQMYEKALDLLQEFGKSSPGLSTQNNNLLLVDVFRDKQVDIYEIVDECIKYLKSDLLDKRVSISIEDKANSGIFYSDQIVLSSFLILLFSHLRNSNKSEKFAKLWLSLDISDKSELIIGLSGNLFVDLLSLPNNKNISYSINNLDSICYLQVNIRPSINFTLDSQANHQTRYMEAENVVKLFKD